MTAGNPAESGARSETVIPEGTERPWSLIETESGEVTVAFFRTPGGVRLAADGAAVSAAPNILYSPKRYGQHGSLTPTPRMPKSILIKARSHEPDEATSPLLQRQSLRLRQECMLARYGFSGGIPFSLAATSAWWQAAP